jgi:hypothetical protein
MTQRTLRYVEILVYSLESVINVSQLQFDEGIDAVIVDSVLAVRKGLTAPTQASSLEGTDQVAVAVPTVFGGVDGADTAAK